ncbi:DUF4271 domain-containing protein [Myroides ceti]|uniref:DUF4271 domain-containing protein n=1 Tax=Paenimyroides ceti TaxID=395087 RepID=A0ABT8CZ18_9FLAO|nr:DUF4271 domain-containing protein [Paenimyroides ceti]MDN3708234.1 DUF4271 domain-containing protein [Paenimyroides ceti]
MKELEFIPRLTQSTDWATLIFLATFILLAVNKNVFSVRFSEYIKLIYSDKYIKIYRDTSNLKSWFTISMFIVQLISFSFIVHIILSTFSIIDFHSFLDFIKVFNFIAFFILAKYLIEKIIAVCFNLEDFAEHYNLLKVNYRTYLGLLLLPVSIVWFYYPVNSQYFAYGLIFIIIAINIGLYFVILKNYEKLILSNIFYFILYLCTLEIAPYLILFKWVDIYKS